MRLPLNPFKKTVRKHLVKLIGECNLYTSRVTEDESARFKELWIRYGGVLREPCCTAESFRIDLRGTPKNPWNTSAAQVFYHNLVPLAERSNDKFKQITDAFYTCIKSLKKEYNHRRDIITHQTKKRHDRRHARKHYVSTRVNSPPSILNLSLTLQLFQCCLEAALTIPELNQHYTILEELTVNGMSSDESDSERLALDTTLHGQKPKYEVTSPSWRNVKLHDWLHVFNVLYIAKRRSSGPSVGEWPHNQFCHSTLPKLSLSTKFVSELPINAYDTHWLGTQYDIEWAVKPVDTEYTFTHNDAVYTLVLWLYRFLAQSNINF
ncbi:hypothetical protein BDZ94DRAFT_1316412 [Collybia nuda]|uniref:Uncharacterized protein n=1 Tax=Collybia nuda TaxID=64659 RepID=A0A9P5XQU2_9AGAR|nr:hypothetical protein BDZ94DRAFT_1316412 [Collybia nuda]